MKITYYGETNGLYIRLSSGTYYQTESIDAGTLVDTDAGGAVIGIEVLGPARPWPLDVILERYELPTDAVRMLRSLWAASQVVAGAPQAPLESRVAILEKKERTRALAETRAKLQARGYISHVHNPETERAVRHDSCPDCGAHKLEYLGGVEEPYPPNGRVEFIRCRGCAWWTDNA